MNRDRSAVNPLAWLGVLVQRVLAGFGRFCVFSAAAAAYIPVEIMTLRGWRRILPQAFQVGSMSVPVILLTGMFIGMVLILQGWAQFDTAGFSSRLGAIVNISLAAELGPVLAGVMLAGRVGGALTAELGTMNVTEQLLALRSMGADPIRYLVTPRFLVCLLLTPILTCYADLAGALGAYGIYVFFFGGDPGPYWQFTADTVEMWDLFSGLIKALFFGGAIGLISCYKGFTCRPGAEGVGRACTEAFVVSFIVILVIDFFLTALMNRLYTTWFGFRPLI